MKTSGNEKAMANAILGAAVARAVESMESASATGIYGANCIAPIESRRDEYIALRDQIWAEEALQKVVETAERESRLEAMRGKLAEIPTYEKWNDAYCNLVLTAGKNDALDKYLAGSAYTAAWYLGLISSTGYSAIVAGDTSASHAGWTEAAGYAAATRPAVSFAAASGGSKATSAAVSFAINADATIKGSFLITNNTKSGTTGIMYSAGLFTAGDKVVQNGDTLNVTYTASL